MTVEADITRDGLESWRLQNTSAQEVLYRYNPQQTLTAAGAASIWGTTILDSTGAAANATLAAGEEIGQRKLFVMNVASNSSTVTVANHVTSSPEVFTFAQVGDALELVWNGATWSTLANSNAAV